jgi:DNA-binding transcriptional LysR family regulator
MCEGMTMAQAAKLLSLSQAAISQRMKKITLILECELTVKDGVQKTLTAAGIEIAKAARESLILLDRALPGHDGSRPLTFHN